MRVGVIGCGNISDIYVANSTLFKDIDVVACAARTQPSSARLSKKFRLKQMMIEELLNCDDIDIVLNLTVPQAHATVSESALRAGKHVYSEKPLATTLEDAVRIIKLASEKGLRVGSAPDTILGAGFQKARRVIEDGKVGTVLTGLTAVMSKGMEHWHPNPTVFYQEGAGPVLDLGPYYVTALVALLGPVRSVQATGLISPAERKHGSEGPNKGETFSVGTYTSINSILSFENGANIVFIASWDVWRHGVRPIELYGTAASIRVPDPDTFGGAVEVTTTKSLRNYHDPKDAAIIDNTPDWLSLETQNDPFGAVNYPSARPVIANYRSLGLAEMANAIAENRRHRCSGDLALHVLAVMTGILEAAQTRKSVDIGFPCEVPPSLPPEEALRLLADYEVQPKIL
jgi:predicted dehydrogenase